MPSSLESGGEVWGEAGDGDGLTQGDAGASGVFAVGIHPHVRQLDSEQNNGGGVAHFTFSHNFWLFNRHQSIGVGVP